MLNRKQLRRALPDYVEIIFSDALWVSIIIIIIINVTRCSAIAERPRCRVHYGFCQTKKTGTGRQYFTDIIGLSSTTVI